MKKIFRFGIVAFALSLCVGSGALALKGHKNSIEAKADAVNPTMVFATDATNQDPRVYSQSGKDLSYLPYSSMEVDTTPDNFTISTGTTFTVQEKESNQLYNYIYESFFVYCSVPANTRYHCELTLQLSLTKNASKGSASASAELFKLGQSDSTTNRPTPSLNNNRFETPNTETSAAGENINNCTTSSASAGRRISNYNTTTTTSLSITYNADNHTGSIQSVRYQLGLFVGCTYGSSYSHQTVATVTVSSKTVTSYALMASVVSSGTRTNYTSLDDALTAAPSGSTVNVLQNCSTSLFENISTQGFSKNLTINLGGKTLSMGSYKNFLAVNNGYSLTINGGGGTIQNTAYENASASPVLQVSNGATLTLSNVTVSKPNGGSAAINVYGTFTASSDVTITTNSSYTEGYAMLVSGNNATAILNGTNVSAYVEAIYLKWGATLRCNAATVSSTNNNAIYVEGGNYYNKLYLYGDVTLSSGRTSGIGAGHVWIESTGSKNAIYANYNSSYLTKAVTVWVSGSSYTEGTTIVYGDKNNKVSFTQLIFTTGLTTAKQDYDLVVVKQTYTVYFNNNGGSGTMSSQNIVYLNEVTLPSCTFTAPSYRTFAYWNTDPNGEGMTRYAGSTYPVTGNVTFYAIWYKSDTNTYDEFRLEYLKMVSYTSNQGYCKDGEHHYYADAKDYFRNSMTKNQRTYFAGNYADEWARFNAWAAANGEEIVLEGGDYVINESIRTIKLFNEATNNTALIIVIASVTSISLVAAFIVIKKRKCK